MTTFTDTAYFVKSKLPWWGHTSWLEGKPYWVEYHRLDTGKYSVTVTEVPVQKAPVVNTSPE